MRMTATQASRSFSDLLSRVASGETVEVDRHGQIVAVVQPPPRTAVSGADLLSSLLRLPRPDRRFAQDVTRLGEATRAPEDPWRS